MIGCEQKSVTVSDTFTVTKIPSATWAVFPCPGPRPEAILKGFQQIYREWFPATDFQHAGLPEIEVYFTGEIQNKAEIWIPVVNN